LRNEIIHVLNPEDAKENTQDGMDAVLCTIDLKSMKMQAACANNPIWLIRNETITELFKPDKIPVGRSPKEETPFTPHETNLQKGDQVYFLTDGFADQFGGPKGKKFKYKQMQQLLLQFHSLSMDEQKQSMEKAFSDWKGKVEQVDDILVIGIKV
jgi:serine phosphatase RsbU (regulator of sigma subunit)